MLIETPPSAAFFATASAGAIVATGIMYFSRRLRTEETTANGPPQGIYPVTSGWRIGVGLVMAIVFLGLIAACYGFGVVAPQTRDTPWGSVLVLLLSGQAFIAAVDSNLALGSSTVERRA
jgi:hypothetical protein